jgi:nucleotide-binding universal stress UspA family protein
MKTLLTTDGSKETTIALQAASRLLRREENDFQVLCVVPELAFPKSGREGRKASRIGLEYRRRMALETEAILEASRRLLKTEGIEAGLISRTGSPSEVITQLAADFDLTVVGARGRYHSPNLGLGPVASRVVEHAPGAVLVARQFTGEGNLRVLVGVDGSAASRLALRKMRDCFNLDEAEITLLHIKETPWIHLGLDREWFDFPGDAFDQADPEIQFGGELQREAEDLLAEARRRLENYNYSVETIIEEGNAATEILGEAERGEYDLIVLGETEQSDMKHGMLGSVSAKIAWQATCSVVVFKRSRL